ncbi:MAG: class I SAM-dependent methyltransferase [Promethearchaeota archaeon]
MYGSEFEDPVVQYYDETVGKSSQIEIKFYLSKVKKYKGPVLDIACGTGRISLLIAREGFNVVSLDRSEGMLSRFKKKLKKESVEVKSRITILNESMSNFRVDKKFNTILCVDAFFHNLSNNDSFNCLKCVKNHLTPEGRFIFNVHNPNTAFLDKCIQSKGTQWNIREKYPLKSKGSVLIEEALDTDIKKQLIFTKLRFTRFDTKDRIIEIKESKWTTRYMYKEEYLDLFEKSDLEVENLVGNYKNEPVSPTSQLIFQIKLKTR